MPGLEVKVAALAEVRQTPEDQPIALKSRIHPDDRHSYVATIPQRVIRLQDLREYIERNPDVALKNLVITDNTSAHGW